MTALNFPDSPTTGDVYQVSGRSWVFDGTVWVSSFTSVATLGQLSGESPITYSSVSGVIGLDESSLLIDGGTA